MKLRILDDIVATVGRIHRICRKVARHDPSLAKQMRAAVNSVGLNSGEGLYARGGNRTVRIESAMNSGREVMLGLRIAGAAGYFEAPLVAREVDALDRIVAHSTSSLPSPLIRSRGRRFPAGGPLLSLSEAS